MNTHYLHALLDDSIRTVGVRFNTTAGTGATTPVWSPKVYTYKTRETFEVDDMAVVETPAGLSVAKVVRVDNDPNLEPNASLSYRWVVQRINREAYEANVEADKAFEREIARVQRNKHRDSLRKAMTDEYPELLQLVKPSKKPMVTVVEDTVAEDAAV